MGMFDHLRCLMPPANPSRRYQTKSLDCDLGEVIIEEDGQVTVDGEHRPNLRCEIEFHDHEKIDASRSRRIGWSAFVKNGRVFDLALVEDSISRGGKEVADRPEGLSPP